MLIQRWVFLLCFLIGCQSKDNVDLNTISRDEFREKSFEVEPHIVDSNSFSTVEYNSVTNTTTYTHLGLTVSHDRLEILNKKEFTDHFNDVVFMPSIDAWLCFKPYLDPPEVYLVDKQGKSLKLDVAPQTNLLVGVFPKVNAFVFFQYGRPPDDHKLFVYQLDATNSNQGQIREFTLEPDRRTGDWFLHAEEFVDEDKNLVGLISNDGYPCIWQLDETGYRKISEKALEYKEAVHNKSGVGVYRAAVSPDKRYIATVVKKQRSEPEFYPVLSSAIRIWDLESGAITDQLNDLESSNLLSISFQSDSKLAIFELPSHSTFDISTKKVSGFGLAKDVMSYGCLQISNRCFLRLFTTSDRKATKADIFRLEE